MAPPLLLLLLLLMMMMMIMKRIEIDFDDITPFMCQSRLTHILWFDDAGSEHWTLKYMRKCPTMLKSKSTKFSLSRGKKWNYNNRFDHVICVAHASHCLLFYLSMIPQWRPFKIIIICNNCSSVVVVVFAVLEHYVYSLFHFISSHFTHVMHIT